MPNGTGQRLVAALLTVALSSSCLSTTTLLSRPVTARVFVDGNYVGETPAVVSNPVVVGERHTVRLEAPGYKDTLGVIAADQWNAGRTAFFVVLGIFTLGLGLFGLLASGDYRARYEFTLQVDPLANPGYGPPAPGAAVETTITPPAGPPPAPKP